LAEMSNIIEVKNLSFAYTNQTVLKDLNFEINKGIFLAIAGPNGAGKTTLLNLLCKLLKPDAGAINVDGKAITSYSSRQLARKIAVVRQEFVPVFDFSVEETVSMARTPYLGTFGFESQADRILVKEALQLTDTERFADRPIGHLSGGERQRVFIARALAQDTPILLLDEPTSFLDIKHQVDIYDLLKSAQLEKGKTIIAVTHDLNLANQYCDEALLLGSDCSYVIGKTTEVLSAGRIEKAFAVKTYAGLVGREKFFMPLGKFAKDRGAIKQNGR
jgi:iron complex transport system ATP-binding protein